MCIVTNSDLGLTGSDDVLLYLVFCEIFDFVIEKEHEKLHRRLSSIYPNDAMRVAIYGIDIDATFSNNKEDKGRHANKKEASAPVILEDD